MHRVLHLLLFLLSMCLGTSLHAAGDYGVATGDMLRITVYDNPDLATETRVTEHGSILFPLIGEVPVANATASEIARKISKGLEQGGFIRNAQVNVVVIEFRGQEVAVLGQVQRPGKQALQKASRLTDVLAFAGGVTNISADRVILYTSRSGNHVRHEVDLNDLFVTGKQDLNMEIANGDILYVPREPRFYIYGEVQRPGTFRLEENMTVVQALSVGGGLNQRGTQRGIKIMRRNAEGVMEEIPAQLSDVLSPNDVIYVKESLF